MGYYLYDSRGYVADAASVFGWDDFAKWARPYPVIDRFVEHGRTTNLPALIAALSKAKARDPSADEVRVGLLQAAKRARGGILILSDGVVPIRRTRKLNPARRTGRR
jgi:hypothetical protein